MVSKLPQKNIVTLVFAYEVVMEVQLATHT